MKRARAAILVAASLSLLAPPMTAAQESLDPELIDRCQAASLPAGSAALCSDAIASIQLLQPELGLLLAGGNPVLGTASPVGTKFRWMPRVQFGGRIGLAWATIPDILVPAAEAGTAGDRSFVMAMPQLDVSVGVFDGIPITTTLGGFGAVEAIASLGTLILPNGEGFEDAATGVGLGLRVGLLRESFTAPGISLTGLYKWFGRVQYGEDGFGNTSFGLDMEAASFRAGISKSFVAFGIGFTLAYDGYWSDVDLQVAVPGADPLQADESVTVIPESDPVEVHSGRWSGFLDFSYIVLFFNVTAELGWQEEVTRITSSGGEMQSGNFFGTIGIRLTL